MNNTNLIRQFAEKGMGWDVFGEIHMFHDGIQFTRKADSGIEIRRGRKWKPWNPLEDWNDCMELVGELEMKGFSFSFMNYLGMLPEAEFYILETDKADVYIGIDSSRKTAICMAAAKALGIDVE